MFEDRLKKIIKDDEQIVLLVRKYFFVFTGQLIFSIIIIIASFFLLYPLFNWGPWGVGIFFLLLVIGLFVALKVLIIYSFNAFIITEQRIIDIDQRGLFDRIVSETTYNKIQDVSFRRKGIMQTMLHYGSVIIQTAGSQANIELHGIKDPEKIHQVIIELQREFSQEGRKISEEQMSEIIDQIKNKTNREQNNKEDK
ncbi:MAG: PH domain-containing protein [Candidatus Kerfeldbacteria bacterium]